MPFYPAGGLHRTAGGDATGGGSTASASHGAVEIDSCSHAWHAHAMIANPVGRWQLRREDRGSTTVGSAVLIHVPEEAGELTSLFVLQSRAAQGVWPDGPAQHP